MRGPAVSSKQTPKNGQRLWQSIPKEARWAMGVGTVLHFGGGQSALTFAVCAAVIEGAKWWMDRDLERVAQGLEREYGVRLSRPPGWRFSEGASDE